MHRPHWHFVEFPLNKIYQYPTLEQANNGRILARAWFNYREVNPDASWAAMTRYLGLPGSPSTKQPGMPFYYLVYHGSLPKNAKIKRKLFKLAGYPWD